MEYFGLAIVLVGLLVASLGQLWFLVRAFMDNVLWGLAIMFIPFAGLIFFLKRADLALKPTVVSFGGLGIMAWGLAIAGEGGDRVLLATVGLAALALVLMGVRMLATSPKGEGQNSDEPLQKAIKLIEAGDKAEARQMLIEILKVEPKNDQAWMWMAEAVESERLRQESLQEALKHNPENWKARQALKLLSGELAWDPVTKIGQESLDGFESRRGGGARRPIMGR